MALAVPATCLGQRPSEWRTYKIADGLPATAVGSVTISSQGRVTARALHLSSASQLDGYSVQVIDVPGTAPARVYESAGGQLWTVVPTGLEEFTSGGWVSHAVPEIAERFKRVIPDPVDPVPLCPVRQGLVLVLLPESLLQLNSENATSAETTVLRKSADMRVGTFSSMSLARDGGLWVAGERGLAKAPGPLRGLRSGSEWQEFLLPETLQVRNLREPLEDETGAVTVLAESLDQGDKIMVHFDGHRWTSERAGSSKILHSWIGPDGIRWAVSGDTLFRWEAGQASRNELEEYPARRYFDFAMEPGGNFWLATSDGLIRYSPLAWRAPAGATGIALPGHCLASDQEGRIWYIAANALHAFDDARRQDFEFPAEQARQFQSASALYAMPNGRLVIDTGGGLIELDPASGKFTPGLSSDAQKRLNALGLLTDGSLLVHASDSGSPDRASRLEVYDGARFKSFAELPTGMPANTSLLAAFQTQAGDLWLATDHGAAVLREKKWKTFSAGDRTAPDAPVGFTELPGGKIWCATQDEIWEFDGKNWVEVRRGFDGIKGMLRAHDGSVWIASNNGLFRFFQSGWVENGAEDGLPAASIRAVCEDQRGRIWAATSSGLGLYHADVDRDPPRTTIQPLPEKERSIPEGAPLVLTFSAVDKWKYTSRQRLLYSYRLDELEWTPFREDNNVVFPDLPAAKHYFQVRAMDRSGNVDPKPAKLEFAVVLPWFREVRLVLIMLAGLGVALFFAGVAYNRHRRLVRSYAEIEAKVEERTRELEIANRELLHSQKMNALGTLAAGIAHDFNNILSIIKGSAQIIEDNLTNPDKVRTRVDRIKTVVEQGAGIVKAMLGFSRESDAQPGLCDVNAVVEDTIRLLGDRFLREVEVSFKPEDELPKTLASRDFIQQILLNFIFNAAESMGQRKQVTLTTSKTDKAPGGLVLAPAQAGGFVCISVRDTGCGIPPENLSRIFEPFFTTKALSARRGTGLGLSMAYELAKKLEAGLAVESVVNHGSTFTLVLAIRGLPEEISPVRRERRTTLQAK